MKTINDAATKFLESRTIAVAGVSSKGDSATNIIYINGTQIPYN